MTEPSGTSTSEPSASSLRAVFGARLRSFLTAVPVLLLARSSRTCPIRTRVTITADASK